MGAALVWFRRDLRDRDHAAFAAALQGHSPVHCVFVFDTEILDRLGPEAARTLSFLHDSVAELQSALVKRGGGLHVLHGVARTEVPRLAVQLGVRAVYANRDYEPSAIARDEDVAARLHEAGIEFFTCKDQVIFELHEVRTKTGGAFSVFTPYRNAWRARLAQQGLPDHDCRAGEAVLASAPAGLPPLADLGFERVAAGLPAGMSGAAIQWEAFRPRLADYAAQRDAPALCATSRLSVHLRFGTISIRALVAHALAQEGEGAKTWLDELAWRDFYFAILAARPDVVGGCYQVACNGLAWDDDEEHYRAWCEGRTGYPLVDAAMRELARTGWMHNRLRMVTASFLVKDLGIDWRRGEDHFARHLLDFDLAANNGGWQWSASTGCDAQPWFRIFHPVTQSRRFDPEGEYIRRWVPEVAGFSGKAIHAPWEAGPLEQQAAGCIVGRDYPGPLVRHEQARERTLARFRALPPRGAADGIRQAPASPAE